MLIEEGFFTFLSKNAAVQAQIGQRLYPVRMPQGVQLPAATYRRAQTQTEILLDEEGLDAATIEIIVWDNDYLTAKNAARVIRGQLQLVTATLGGITIHNLTWEDESDEYDAEALGGTGLIGIRAAFQITAEEA